MHEENRHILGLKGDEVITITGISGELSPRKKLDMTITYADGRTHTTKVTARIDTLDEIEYFKSGGIMQYVLKGMAKAA
jgi:aconitate hydratase